MKKVKSLKKQILQLLIFFSISVIIIFGAISILNLYNSKIEIIKHNQNVALKQVSKEVQNLNLDIENIADYISNNYSFSGNLLKNVVETNQNISSILILDRKGLIEDFYAMSNLNIYKGFDYSNKNYFKELNNSNNSYWTNVFLSTVDEEPSISYSFRMADKIGVIMINLSELSNFLLRFKNHDNSHMIRIFDKNGIMIINPDDKQLVLQRFNAITSEVFTKLVKEKEPYTQVIFSSIKNDGKQFGAYTTIKRTGWTILVRENHDYILKSLNSVVLLIIFAIIVFIILSIYLSLGISNRIFKSFDNMETITSKISNGNYTVENKNLYYDEFNNLLNSFNKMQVEIDKREDTLENSLNSFKSLFNSTMESIILHENKICFDVNNVCLDLFGATSKDDLIGKNILDLVAPEYRRIVENNLLVNSEPYEIELIKIDGSRIQALVQGKFLKLENRLVRVSALIDITELKNKDQLLFQQSKMASMGEMIGNIAHQWRQPLSIISTCASGVKFEKEFSVLSDDRLNESMDMIVENTQYLSRTIDDFRNFFKSEKNLQLFVVSDIVKKALKLLSSNIKNNEIELFTRFSNNEFSFEGYPNEFIQVLINIINNSKDAFLANNSQERCIEISELEYKDKYILQIKDNAGGIPTGIIDKIFDPYFTTKHKSQGTGIGLYMSHQIIVDHMNGKLKVKNIEFKTKTGKYKGSCFIIELPKNPVNNYTYSI
ncbi:ATP-binding protein [Arcobacter sp. LA11]|uniref:ATP-binding protein n=1 Tax=Arcobacter sp. LA11 TaxID=1898176 RepID=UPI0009323003|nr:ATP-binding protein [Arcobacter sp. LA11]